MRLDVVFLFQFGRFFGQINFIQSLIYIMINRKIAIFSHRNIANSRAIFTHELQTFKSPNQLLFRKKLIPQVFRTDVLKSGQALFALFPDELRFKKLIIKNFFSISLLVAHIDLFLLADNIQTLDMLKILVLTHVFFDHFGYGFEVPLDLVELFFHVFAALEALLKKNAIDCNLFIR